MTAAELIQQSDHITNSPATKQKLEKLHYQNFLRLGGSSIDVHLEEDDFTTAWEIAVQTYRECSAHSIYPSFVLLGVEPTKQQYVLDSRIDNVIRVWRARGLFGGQAGGSGAFESFGAATANTLLRGGIGQNGAAFDLFSYDLVLQYQETLDRLFTREMHFIWRSEANTIFFTQVPNQNEEMCLEVSVLKSYEELLNDHWSRRWLQEYCLAEMKIMLGEKYRVFSTLPGAQGGTVMKGEALVSEGWDRKTQLEDDARLYADGGGILQPIRG
jgi:hypothetical protein